MSLMNERCFSRCFVIIPQISLHDISDIIKKNRCANMYLLFAHRFFAHI